MLTDGLNINEKGHLTIGGCDTVELAETYGTPLYVMNEEVIRQEMCIRDRASGSESEGVLSAGAAQGHYR